MAKIEIDKTELQKALAILSSGMPSKSIVPADGVYKFDAKKDKCYITISNFSIEMQIYLPCKSDEEVSFCTPQFIMENTVKNFPDGAINITTERNEADTSTINVSLTPEGRRKKYKVACAGYETSFPHWPVENDEPAISIKTMLGELSEKIKIAGANVDPSDPTQVYQNISFLNDKGCIKIVSGNAHLAVGIDTGLETKNEIVVPASINKALSQLGSEGEVNITIDHKRLYLNYSNVSVKLKMHEGAPPPYMNLFNEEPERGVTIDRLELLGAINRMMGVGMKFNKILLECGTESLKAYSSNDDFGHEGEEFLEVENPMSFKTAMNCKYLQRALTSTKSEKIKIKVVGDGSANRPIFLVPEDQSIPMRWIISPIAT